VADVAPDQEIVTRLADGTVRSTVGMVKTVNRVNRVNRVEKTDTEIERTTKDGKA
jgi:hypothetical protein